MKTITQDIPDCLLNLEITNRPLHETTVDAQFLYPSSFIGFQGHFPAAPILPAIVQLATVRYCVEQALGRELVPMMLTKTKFRSMIAPEQKVFFTITIKQSDREYSGKFTIRSADNELIADGKYTYQEAR